MFENGCYLRRQKRFKCPRKQAMRLAQKSTSDGSRDDDDDDDEHDTRNAGNKSPKTSPICKMADFRSTKSPLPAMTSSPPSSLGNSVPSNGLTTSRRFHRTNESPYHQYHHPHYYHHHQQQQQQQHVYHYHEPVVCESAVYNHHQHAMSAVNSDAETRPQLASAYGVRSSITNNSTSTSVPLHHQHSSPSHHQLHAAVAAAAAAASMGSTYSSQLLHPFSITNLMSSFDVDDRPTDMRLTALDARYTGAPSAAAPHIAADAYQPLVSHHYVNHHQQQHQYVSPCHWVSSHCDFR